MSRFSDPLASQTRDRHDSADPGTHRSTATLATVTWTQDTPWMAQRLRTARTAAPRSATHLRNAVGCTRLRCTCTPAVTPSWRRSASSHRARCSLDAPRRPRTVGCRPCSSTTAGGRSASGWHWVSSSAPKSTRSSSTPPPCFTTPASIHYRNSGAPGAHHPYRWRVSREAEDLNRRLLRARDAMDRAYAQPLDVRVVAAVAHISPAHFSRCFRSVFGETPHRYLQRRRIERSMFLLRQTDRTVTNICFDVGFTSLGTFSRTFRWIVGETPSGYRTGHGPVVAPHCVQLAAMRPRSRARPPAPSSSFGEASLVAAP